MPSYDLYCSVCDKEFKASASIAEKSENRIACPDCGTHDLKTVFKSAPAYIKGAKPQACPNSGGCGKACPHAG